jgi:predicted DNA-binding protein (MmcQ/YjbR family)
MFDEDDPVLGRLREVCLALPAAEEHVSHGRPTFRCGRIFAVYGGGVKLAPGQHVPHDHALLVKADPGEVAALDQDDRFFLPAYYGPFGWRGLDLDAADVDWAEVAELVDASYRLVAPRRRVAELDEAGPGARAE